MGGPVYVSGYLREYLAYTCMRCGYQSKEHTLDHKRPIDHLDKLLGLGGMD